MFQCQALSRIRNSRGRTVRNGRYLQKKLMLLWVQACLLSSTRTEVQEAAKLEAKFSQSHNKGIGAVT